MIMMHLSDKNYCFVNHNLGFNHINDEFLSLNFHIKTHTASGKSFLASNTEGVYCHRHSVNEWDFHPLFINFLEHKIFTLNGVSCFFYKRQIGACYHVHLEII